LDALQGRISVRQLRVMIENLPPDGPVAWCLRDGDTWGETEWLLYDVSTQLRVLNTRLANRYRAKGTKEVELELYKTQQQRREEAEVDMRPEEQVQAERDHLQQVLARQAARLAAEQADKKTE